MEEKKKFRNHISVIIERTGAGFFVLLGILFWQLIDDPQMILELSKTEGGLFWLIVVIGGVLVLIFIILFIQYIIWSKTYICVDGTSIVFERNTLKYQKKTIGIKNISNVNTEQNLFEMLLGTSKIKLDTNSMSTADSTDLIIVLKKKDALELKDYILSLMNEMQEADVSLENAVREESIDVKEAGLEQMMIHGLLSIRLISVLIAIGAFGGLVGMIKEAVSFGVTGLIGQLSGILLLLLFAVSSSWTIVKGFLQYYGFQVERKGGRLYIRYGLLKKVNYTIPIDKINAIRMIQSPQARIMNYYTVELINVGMGDNKEEEQSFFLMYDKAVCIKEEMKRLLPEFADCQKNQMQKQPESVWFVWMMPFLFFAALFFAGLFVVLEIFPESLTIMAPVAAGFLFLVIGLAYCKYRTEGYALAEDYFGLCKGAIGKETIFVKYEKIQYLRAKQNFLAKYFHVLRTDLFLLASTANRLHEVPYMPEVLLEGLKEKILER